MDVAIKNLNTVVDQRETMVYRILEAKAESLNDFQYNRMEAKLLIMGFKDLKKECKRNNLN